MKLKKTTNEAGDNMEWKNTSWIRKIITTSSIVLAWLFSSCDNVPNDQIILDYDKESIAFSIEYQFWRPDEWTLVDYNIYINKNWDKYEWTIEKSNWFIPDETKIEANNIDDIFNEISKQLDSEYITEKTTAKKNSKLTFAKEKYQNEILNKKTHKTGKSKIKYKK